MKVIKRDGRTVLFDSSKIVNAVLRAFEDEDDEITPYANNKAWEIANYVKNLNKTLKVEEIQDIVEEKLMASNRKDVARSYIIYRNERTRIRNQDYMMIKNIKKRIDASGVENSNANMDERSFGGRIGAASDDVMKQYALDYCVSPMAKYNHENNRIYIHDLSSYPVGMHNCLTIPFDDLLTKGFNTRQTDVRPANSIGTAFQLVAVIFQLQSLMQYGGVSASHLDWTMVPYVRKSFIKHWKDGMTYIEAEKGDDDHFCKMKNLISNSNEWFLLEHPSIEDEIYGNHGEWASAYDYAFDMTQKELKQAVEGMYHNLNTLQSRSGNQLPFTSINYGTCTLPEGRMIIKALLEGSIKGVGKFHKTSIFPCGIFQLGKGINRKPGDPNYDLYQLALKSTAQRLYPNYANIDWSGNAGYDKNDPRTYFSTMGCRTANGWDINGFGQLKDGRGNICPVTIILPTLAMEAKETVERENKYTPFAITTADEWSIDLDSYVKKFMNLLDEAIHDAKDMLLERFEYICSQDAASAKFMYENGTMAGYIPEEGIRSALKHGTLAIGQLGLAEALQILIGHDHTEEIGMELAKKIEQLFKDRCAEFKEEEKLNFGVYYTPAESLAFTAMTKFKEKYGVIPNVSENKYFTNSIHVPVWKEMTPIEKIDIESQLTGYSSAGCITYVELPGTVKNNLKALETIVNYAMDHDIPYFAVNIPVDTCMNCGYTDELGNECPECGSTNIQRLRRVTGYLTGNYTTAFNEGKQQEVEMRVKHIKSF